MTLTAAAKTLVTRPLMNVSAMDSFAFGVAAPFLDRAHRAVPSTETKLQHASGRFFLIHAVVAMVVGGVVGGRLTDRLGARRGTLLAGALLGATLLAAAWVIALGEGHEAQRIVPWLTATYVAIGWFTAASYAIAHIVQQRRDVQVQREHEADGLHSSPLMYSASAVASSADTRPS